LKASRKEYVIYQRKIETYLYNIRGSRFSRLLK
jgi:hypothetical protein